MPSGVAAVASTRNAVPRSAEPSWARTAAHRVALGMRAALAFLGAWRARAELKMEAIRFPTAEPPTGVVHGDVAYTLKLAHTLVRFGAAWSHRKCFLRTFIVVSVLRRYGLDARMNVGLVGLDAGQETSGHCWTTCDGKPIGETNDPGLDYPHAMGTGPNGIHYWLGATTTRRAS